MIEIYFKQVINRKKEIIFFNFLSEIIGDFKHYNKNYLLPDSMLNNYLNIDFIINKLKKELKLSELKRNKLLSVLKELPNEIKVAEKISNISVDFVIKNTSSIQYIEFHEKQHRNLSDSRLKPIFTKNNHIIKIPRYAQRFLKDFWRWRYLKNYKIVWWDWFKGNQYYGNILQENKREYSFKDKFSFSKTFQ